jgi:hypothetical protein
MAFLRPALLMILPALGATLAACAPAPVPMTASPSMEAHMDKLEAGGEASHPYRNAQEIQANIDQLTEARSKLLARYTPTHPEIRDIDRRLRILDAQLRMLQ